MRTRRFGFGLIGVVGGIVACAAALALSATPAAAATCEDYSSQRDAQRAADTRDSDSDGVYCESLPCPCLRPGAAGEGGREAGTGAGRLRGAQRIRARVVDVTDGDTIEVRSLERTARRFYDVRMIGIDTPEVYGGVECGGRQASNSMHQLARRGMRVTLRTDPTQDLFDRYGRLLAYVYRGGTDLGEAQLRRGWASVYVFETRFRRLGKYLEVQSATERGERGIFGRCAPATASILGELPA